MAHRVLVVDDHAVVREGLRRLLGDYGEIEVVGEASDGHEALRMCLKHRPDVVVLDLSMPGLDGIEVTKELATRCPQAKVLMLTMHANEEYAMRVLQAGARGFIGKGASGQELAKAIIKIAEGGTYLPAALLESLPRRLAARGREASPLESLSDRELQVLKLLAVGRTGREIGEQLHLSVKTIDTYRARVLSKLGLETTADLIRFALRHRVIEDAF